ncbi:LPD38 domain-containing protein [Bacteroidales bacterium MB20-C3-3]|nr:LPD38 domain-containing protein [Bacteroidales bacterium MB20-C3-3]
MTDSKAQQIDSREKLYNNLIGTGRVSEKELGKKEDFLNSITSASDAAYLYKNLKTIFDEEEIGDERKFTDYVLRDITGPFPAGRPGGNLPLPSPAETTFAPQNPFVIQDKAPAPLMSKANAPIAKSVDQVAQQASPIAADSVVSDVEGELKELNDRHKEELAKFNAIKQKMNIPDVDSFTGYNARESRMMGLGGLLSKAKISKEEREFYEKNKERLEDVEKQMKAMLIRRDVANLAEQQESLDPNSPGIKKFWDGLTKSGTVKDFLTMGLSTMRDDVYMIELLEKASKDKNSINPEEQKLIDSYMKLQEMQSKDNGFWYKAGAQGRMMVPFIVNIMATGGVAGAVNLGKAAGAETFKAAIKGGKRQAVDYAVRKTGSIVLGNMLRSPLTTTFYTDLAKRRVGNFSQDEHGQIEKGDNTLAGDLYKSYVTNTLEYMTEGFGDLVGRGALTSLLAKKRILGPMSKYVSALEKVTANPVYKKVGGVLDKAQIHGISTEIFVEEVPNALLSSLLTGSDDYKQLADPEFYGTIAVNTALMNGIFKGTQLVSGGVANAVEKGRLNSAAKTANANLATKASELNDQDIIQAIEGVQNSINSNGYFNEDKSESAVIQAFQNLREVINKKGVNEDLESVIDAASKAVLINAERAGAYEGLLSVAEAEMGGPVTMRKSPDTVAIGKNANEELMYITDVLKSELGKELMVVRNVNTGESKTILSDEIEDIRTFDSKAWLDDWLKTRDALKPIESAIQSQEIADEVAQQQESAQSQPVNLSEVIPGAEFAIGEEIVTVIDATEEDIFVVDRDGNEHRVEIESLQRVPPVTQEAPAADVNAVNLPIQDVQQLPIEPVQEPESAATIEEAQQAEAGNSITGGISIPVDKQGQIDYSQIAEPKMYAEALKSEFADESLSVLEDLIAEQKEALKKAEKTTNAIERRRKIKIVNTELAKLNQAKTMLSPEQDISSVQVAQESAQEISNPKPIQKPTRRPGGKRLTPMQQDLMKFGEPTTREEAIAMTILRDGIKFRMNDNKAEGIKGLAGHLGLKKGGKEYRKYFGLQNEKTGMSPEHLALYIKEMDDDGLFVNLEDSDIFTDVLEVMRKAYSRRTLFEIIETSRRDQERRFNEEDYYESEEIKSNIASKEELTEEEYEEIIDDYFSEKYLPLSEQDASTILNLIADSVKDEERWRIINESEDLPEDETGRNIAEGVYQRGAGTDVSGGPAIGNQSQYNNEGRSNEGPGGRTGTDKTILQGAALAQSEQSVNPLRKEIESLNQSKKEAIAERDRLIANSAERVGLFGDTKQDPNDLFGGEGFDPSASQPLVDNQNKIIAELDRKIEVLTKNLEQGEREAQGQLKIEEIAQEEARVNTEPTEKQKEAGNYQKGHIKLLGYDVTIEQPKGSTRSGVDKGGKEWSVTMNNTYGYILGTKGKDGEHIDVFVGENPLSEKVYVVDQVNQDGSFDEHKVMFGFDSIEDASKAYNANYEEGWQGLGNITEVSIDDFQKWTENKTRKIKPFAEYKQIRSEQPFVDAPIEEIESRVSEYESIINEREENLKSSNTPITGSNTGVGTLTEAEFSEFTALTSELQRRNTISADEAKLRVEEKRKQRLAQLENDTPIEEGVLQPDVDNESGEPGAEMSEAELKESQETAEKLQDFGQKIGMARKDVAERGFTRTGKDSELPGWAKKYKVFQQKKGTSYADWDTKDGKYEVAIVSGNFFKIVQKNFDTPEAAASAIPLLEVARNHYVRPSSASNDEYSIYRRWSSGKLWEIKKGFKSRDEAMLHMAVNAVSIIEAKDVKVERPHLDNIERIGIEIRKGNITPEQFMDTFGFRGGEFGNWVASDERQSMLNYAYDALVDLAAVINISPRALSLGGRLAIGFGSRGKGLSNAAAHFEADRGVINLTKINGAGALAHEWFHAMDSYFGVFGNQGFVPNEEGVIKSPDPSRDYLSGDYYNNKKVRDEVVKAWNGVWKAMRYKEEMAEYDITRLENKLESSKDSLVRALQNTRGWLAVDRKWGLRKKAATPEQLKSWDALIERVNNYDFGPTSKAETKKKYSFESVYEVQKQLSELTKVISGRSALGADFYSFHRVVMAKDQLENAKSDQTYLKKVNTTFYNGSKDMDASRSSAYWSTNLEMAARGFEAYVDDKLKAVGAKNDYLVHSVNNAVYVALYDAKPYPEGQERLDINNAFDTFFSTIDEKIDEETGNTVLFRQPYFYSPTEQALNSIKQEKGTPEQWKAMLLKNGAKEAEMEWMGWEERFGVAHIDPKMTIGGQGVKLIITKSEIQDWINQNRIEVQEVEKSEKPEIKWTEKDGNTIGSASKAGMNFLYSIRKRDNYFAIYNDLTSKQLSAENTFEEAKNYIENKIYKGYYPQGDTKYSQYQLPGGENYKELLLTMPVKGNTITIAEKEELEVLQRRMNNEIDFPQKDLDRFRVLMQKGRDSYDNKSQFKSSHFDEPNILAHVRFNERTTPSGERVLFIEEIQSDWAQKGKKEGFAGKPNYKKEGDIYKVYDGAGVFFLDAKTEEEAKEIIKTNPILEEQGVPDMPFKNTDQWVNLALRRMMIYAAENGFDRIAWTNGEMQADRYNLSKQTDFIDYWKNDNGTYDFGLSIEFNKPSELTESELESYLGKDIANKIINDKSNPTEHNPARLEGNDLKVGGSGMKAFYDNIIPAQVNKIGKKFGAKVETTEIPAIGKKVYDEDAGERNLTPEAEELYQKYMDSVAEDDGSYPIEQYVSDMENIGYEVVLSETGYPIDLKKTYKGEVYSVQSIPITPAIKEQAAIGMPLYMPESGMEQVDYKGLPLETVVNTVREFARSLNTEVKIIYDTQQYPSNSRYRRAKGWFRPISGEVTIVLSKHNSINDLKTTILHEVVGHKGLRNLLGDTFKKTMQRVFISLPKSVQADYFARYNNRVTAAEEYLSELTKYDIHPTLWQRIKGIIRDALRSVGVFINMSDADMKYMLWRSKNRLQDQAKATSIEVMTDIVKSREKQSRLRSEADVLLREEREPFTLDSNDITLNKWEKTIEALQDRMVSGKKLIEEIKKRGGKVGVFSNFVSEENRSSSRAKAELDDFEDNYYKPILDIVAKWAKEGKSADEISLYMMAKHAPERNRHIVIRDARESILYGFNKDLRKAEGKRRSATAEKDIKAIDESIRNIQSQIDFINSAENAGLIAEIMRNAYDVAFNHDNRSPLPEGMDSLSYMIALNIQKRAISMLSKVAESELSNNRSGLSDEEAADIVNEFEKGLKEVKDVVMFWDNIRKATRFSLDKSLKYGLISKEVHAATSNMYEFYVPLRSWAEKEDIDYQDVFGDNYLGHEILNPVNKHAEGRTSLADNPLGFIASMAETSIVAGSKNEVRRNAWRLIKNNDHMTDLFLIKQAWEVNIADIGDEPIWETTYEPPTQELIDAGMARRLSPNKTYEWHKSRGDIKKHQVPVLIDGSRVLIEFKGPIGARIAAAINGDDVVRWKRTEGIARLTRIMAALKTSKNPDFMLTNFLRDYFFGTMAYSARGGSSLTMTKNLGRAWIAIHKDFTKGKEDSYLKEMYDDFKMSGGETGYVHMLGEQDYKRKVEKLVKEANKAGSVSPTVYAKKTIKVLNHGLDYLAHMSENAVRFATYLTEVERLTKEAGTKQPSETMKKQAALAAKEVTTNFNRKGKWSSQVNSFYAFFNASVQGSANYIKLAKENPKGFVLYNMAMMSIRTALAAWCLSLFGDDDDEKGYLALSDYIKENNFVIPAGDSKFITIPLPHGARALTNIGPLALDVVMGKKSAAEAMDTYSKNIISELSPINLVGLDKSAFIPRKADEVLLTMLPTVVRPFAETALNMDFMSRPIERGNFLATDNGYLPRFRNAYSSTNPILVGLAKELNRLGGGNDSRSAGVKVDKDGNVSRSKVGELLDVSPAYTEHILEGYFGGLGRFINDMYKTTRSAIQGNIPEKQNIPVVRRLYQEPYESLAWQKYYETRSRVNDITKAMKAAKQEGMMEEYMNLNNYYNNTLISTFEIYNDIMKNISSNIKQLPEESPMRKQAEKAMDELVNKFNEEIKYIDANHNKRR